MIGARATCIKRIYEIDPLECPKCKAQMRIIAFIQEQKYDSQLKVVFDAIRRLMSDTTQIPPKRRIGF